MGYLLTDRFLNEKIMFYADRKLEKKLKDTKVIKIFKLLNYANYHNYETRIVRESDYSPIAALFMQ